MIREAIGTPCLYCAEILDVENLGADHKDPKSKKGTHREENLRLICKTCNTVKGSFAEEAFIALITTARQFNCEDLLRTRLKAANLVFGGK